MKRSILPLIVLFLSACGAREHYVIKEPARPLASFGQVEVKPFTVDPALNETLSAKNHAAVSEVAASLAETVTELLRQRERTSSSDAPERLIIEGRIVSFDPGSRALRYWVGMGAGSGKVIAEVRFLDALGADLGTAEFKGGVTMGGFGGTNADAALRLAREVADYVSGRLNQAKAAR